MGGARTQAASARLDWLDVVKGLAILWIAWFHFFDAWADKRFPSPFGPRYLGTFLEQCAPDGAAAAVACAAKSAFVAVSLLGFHGVGVFLLISGFSLTRSLAARGSPATGWSGWYRARLLRLFPMYWTAHAIYLVSPFVWRTEPIDWRFALSLLGDRFWPVDSIFYYLNPAWWYFGLLLQLYLVFPLLFLLLRRLGAARFLLLCGAVTILCRHLLLAVLQAHGHWVQGAFFGARLWEFAFGMALGLWHRRDAAAFEARLFSPGAWAAGAALYAGGLASYANGVTYTLTDALLGSGLFVLLAGAARAAARLRAPGAALATVGAHSYGLYLIHQPYVLWFGVQLRELSLPLFLLPAAAVLAVLTRLSIPLERGVDRLARRWLERGGAG